MEQEEIEQWAAAHGTLLPVALRSRIVLATAAGKSDVAIAEKRSVNRNTVILCLLLSCLLPFQNGCSDKAIFREKHLRLFAACGWPNNAPR